MNISKLKREKCTGCYACYNICMKDAIEMQRDREGFSYPAIHTEKCIECGLCAEVCPSFQKVSSKHNFVHPHVYAAWSNDEQIRLNSTSGGIFSEIAKYKLSQNACLCGAQYGKNQHIEHCIVESESGLEKIRQSKYAQSDIGLVYREIRKLLHRERQVLFCGTPCQCAALIKYLGQKHKNLTLIDFVCRGVNSPMVYEAFLDSLEKKYHSKVKKVWFKNKTYGWNRFSTRIEFENGSVYLKDRYHDTFIVGYIKNNLYMRPSCAVCDYKGFPRISDITLADFWDVTLKNPYLDTEKGTSLIMINSDQGLEIFEHIKSHIFWEEKTLEDALRSNSSITKPPVMNLRRNDFFRELEHQPFEKVIKKYSPKDISVKRTLKFMIPNKWRMLIKYYLHK